MKRNIFRLLLSAVLMMCCTVMANAQSIITIPIYEGKQPAVGDGSKENPYQIADYDNLCWFSWIVAHGQPSACAELIADITADGEHNWYPIGPGYRDRTIRYTGEFNGNGHTVTGLVMFKK